MDRERPDSWKNDALIEARDICLKYARQLPLSIDHGGAASAAGSMSSRLIPSEVQ